MAVPGDLAVSVVVAETQDKIETTGVLVALHLAAMDQVKEDQEVQDNLVVGVNLPMAVPAETRVTDNQHLEIEEVKPAAEVVEVAVRVRERWAVTAAAVAVAVALKQQMQV